MVRRDLRIVVVSSSIPECPSEVTYSFVFDEAWRLSQRGIEVHAVRASIERGSSYAYDLHFHSLRHILDFEVVPFLARHVPTLPLPLSFIISPRWLHSLYHYGLNVANVVKEHGVNIIHAHFAYPEGFVGLLAKRETKRPLIVTLHGYDILTEPTIGYGVRQDRRFDVIVKKVLKEADIVIASSTATYKEALRADCQPEKLVFVPNGVDVNRFSPNIDGRRIRNMLGIGDRPMIFTLRHHVAKNGIEYLIRCAHLVLKEKPNAMFVIGGDGPLRRKHEELAKDLGIVRNVIFTEHIPQKEVPFYYAACDIFIIPSLIEAFGLVVSEAMASGKPVIGSNVGGIPDQIIDDFNGFLVKPMDPSAIAEKILYLYEHQEEAKRMGRNGAKIAKEKFDVKDRVDRILALYEQVLTR